MTEGYTETIKQGENLPTPSQLRKIALKALLLANNNDTLFKLTNKKRIEPTLGWVDSQYYEQDGERFQRASCLLTRKVLALPDFDTQIERPVVVDAWRLRYHELMQEAIGGGEWVGVLKRYVFEWDSVSTSLAICHTRELPSVDQEDIDGIRQLIINGRVAYVGADGRELDADEIFPGGATPRGTSVVGSETCEEILLSLDRHQELIRQKSVA